MAVWQRRTVVLGSLTLCAMGLSACQTTGTPETNAAPGVVQNSSQAAALGAAPHQDENQKPIRLAKTGDLSQSADGHWRRFLGATLGRLSLVNRRRQE